jgi:hypothetical protein
VVGRLSAGTALGGLAATDLRASDILPDEPADAGLKHALSCASSQSVSRPCGTFDALTTLLFALSSVSNKSNRGESEREDDRE